MKQQPTSREATAAWVHSCCRADISRASSSWRHSPLDSLRMVPSSCGVHRWSSKASVYSPPCHMHDNIRRNILSHMGYLRPTHIILRRHENENENEKVSILHTYTAPRNFLPTSADEEAHLLAINLPSKSDPLFRSMSAASLHTLRACRPRGSWLTAMTSSLLRISKVVKEELLLRLLSAVAASNSSETSFPMISGAFNIAHSEKCVRYSSYKRRIVINSLNKEKSADSIEYACTLLCM